MKYLIRSSAVALALVLSSCATMPMAPAMPVASTMISPTPIEGTSGLYMSPFTSDGVTAGWITESMKVSVSGQAGAFIGQQAGQQLMSNIPLFGGMLGEAAGKQMGRQIALRAIGGEEFLKSSSDLSFNSLNDMAVFMYANYSTHPEYDKIVQATYAIYPDLQPVYLSAIQRAPHRPL
ncbi:hypothetical protein [Brevundimonas sp.]|jgi:hypothetical protein|uniref:hypothetical protein n=1 Tax=Brevundimonas sp. TaxID=1871086 RepID=UPI00378333D2